MGGWDVDIVGGLGRYDPESRSGTEGSRLY